MTAILVTGTLGFAAIIAMALYLHKRQYPDDGPQCSDYDDETPVRTRIWGGNIERGTNNEP